MMREQNDGGTPLFIKPLNIELTPGCPAGSVLLGMQ